MIKTIRIERIFKFNPSPLKCETCAAPWRKKNDCSNNKRGGEDVFVTLGVINGKVKMKQKTGTLMDKEIN